MSVNLKVLAGVGLLAIAPASFAQNYSMDLTSVGNGTVADGVYVSPYVATISGPGMSYSGFVICDDFNSEAYLNTPWIASMSNAGALNGTQQFGKAPGSTISFGGSSYTIQQAYNAAGWLANGLLANLSDTNVQTNYSFAIWDIFDGQSTNPDGGAPSARDRSIRRSVQRRESLRGLQRERVHAERGKSYPGIPGRARGP